MGKLIMGSEKRFGYEWKKYSRLDPNYESQFKNWISPLQPEIFKGKKVLDAGCGMGRNSYWALKYGAKELVAFDYDKNSLKSAYKNLNSFKNAFVVYKSIYQIDWQDQFDIVFCIGVIHHLQDSQLAIINLKKALKLGGLLLIWVYGYENNEWIVKWINPIRRNITSKLPVSLLHFLSYFCSFPLWLYLKIRPPKSAYLKQISTFKYKHLHSIVFDQLLPAIANYYKKDEAYHLLSQAGLKNINISHTNNKSWTVYGYKL